MWSEEEKQQIGERNRQRGPQSKDTIHKNAKLGKSYKGYIIVSI